MAKHDLQFQVVCYCLKILVVPPARLPGKKRSFASVLSPDFSSGRRTNGRDGYFYSARAFFEQFDELVRTLGIFFFLAVIERPKSGPVRDVTE